MVTDVRYRAKGREFLAQAKAELAAGDLPQASEKGWGAAAQMVKAVAEHRGWQHRHHGLLTDAVERLVGETGDEELADLFAIANSLHVNFYEDRLRSGTVSRHLDAMEALLDRLEPLLLR